MIKKLHKNVIHNSPAAEVLKTPEEDLVLQIRKLARFLTAVSPRTATADLVLQPHDRRHDVEGMVGLRDLVAESELVSHEKFGVRLSVVTNEDMYRRFRSQFPGCPINNWHTDFRLRRVEHGGELYVPRSNRLALIIDGKGTEVLHGEVGARRAETFVLDRVGGSFEHRMEDLRPVLLGAEGQIVRGPRTRSILHQFRGDYVQGELPEGEWCELPSQTIHRSPPDLPRGRAVLNVDLID